MPPPVVLIGMIANAVGLAGVAAALWLAWTKGNYPERYGASMIALIWLVDTIAFQVVRFFGLPSFEHLYLITELVGAAVGAMGFLVLAVRYSAWWLGCAMLVQASEFGLIAHYLGHPEELTTAHARNHFIFQQNVMSFCLLAILICGTLASWRGDVLRKRREAEEAANPKPEPFAWVGTAALMKAHEKALAKPPAQP